MRQQTKPFIVEIKQSRKPKTGPKERSIWGKLDLRVGDNPVVKVNPAAMRAIAESND